MWRRTLQVVGHGEVVLVAELVLDELGDQFAGTAKLRMTERVARAGFGEQLAVGVTHAFRRRDRTVTVAIDAALHRGQEFASSNGTSGNRMICGRFIGLLAGQAGGRDQPAGVASHHFEHEDLGRRFVHRLDIDAGFEHRDRRVFRGRTETRAVVGDHEVVVDGLRHADAM